METLFEPRNDLEKSVADAQEGGLLAEFTWILEKMGFGFGISLNPGLDLEPEAIRQITTAQGQQ